MLRQCVNNVSTTSNALDQASIKMTAVLMAVAKSVSTPFIPTRTNGCELQRMRKLKHLSTTLIVVFKVMKQQNYCNKD
ncbi:hypothetical protein SAE01_47930 [Segetibacter aerophilus]|uniref:Uncharacterized protein n=1 Tax=Segetibacter aerophilus TaxID=670293 RepID=A0A512BKD7_9BACT|nr:hypothetical protein SAE01_47930 [Segetibacter aerophilus]